MSVKVDLRNTMNRARFLVKKSEETLRSIGYKTITNVVRQWIRGIGGSGVSLQRPQISSKYKKQKMKLGRPGMIDMVLHGKLTSSMQVRKKYFNAMAVGVSPTQEKKAKGLYRLRPQFMELSKAFRRQMLIYYYNKLRAA